MSGPKFQLQRSLRTLVSLALLSMAVPDGARGEEGGGASKDPDPQAAAGTGDDASEPDPSRLEVQRGEADDDPFAESHGVHVPVAC